jgi:hypothetical protein
MVEHRKAMRYAVRLPVIFTWSGGEQVKGGGFTRDLSTVGVYVLCDHSQRPQPGATVSFEILLPPLEENIRSLQLRAEGYAIRINSLNEETGFALITNLASDEQLIAISDDDQWAIPFPVFSAMSRLAAGREINAAMRAGNWPSLRIGCRNRTGGRARAMYLV